MNHPASFCWVCLRNEVQPSGWCRKCENFIGIAAE
jgi:hypothetical protein